MVKAAGFQLTITEHRVKIFEERIAQLADRYCAIKNSIGNRRIPSEYSKKSRGRLMRAIEKDWQFYTSLQD